MASDVRMLKEVLNSAHSEILIKLSQISLMHIRHLSLRKRRKVLRKVDEIQSGDDIHVSRVPTNVDPTVNRRLVLD